MTRPTLALAALLVAGACAGGPAGPGPESGPTPSTARQGSFFWFLAKPRIDRARQRGEVEAGVSDATLLDRCRLVVADRLRRARLKEPQVKVKGALLWIRVTDCPAAQQARVVGLATARPRLRLTLLASRALAGMDLDRETERLWVWLKRDNNLARVQRDPLAIAAFNALPTADGGPLQAGELTWAPLEADCPYNGEALVLPPALPDPRHPEVARSRRFVPLCTGAGTFTHRDMDPSGFSRLEDSRGQPMLAFALKPGRAKAFGDFSEQYLGMNLAIVLDGRVVHAPLIKTRMPGRGVISWCGKAMTAERMDALIIALQAPPLPVPLEPLGR